MGSTETELILEEIEHLILDSDKKVIKSFYSKEYFCVCFL